MKNIAVRLLPTRKDDPELVALINTQNTLAYLSETRSYAVPMAEEFAFRIQVGSLLIGEARLKSLRWYNRKAEISMFILDSHRNKGLGEDILRQLLDYAFNVLDLHRIEGEVYDYNAPSLALAKKIGFVEEGLLREAKFHNGEYHNIIRLGLLKREYNSK